MGRPLKNLESKPRASRRLAPTTAKKTGNCGFSEVTDLNSHNSVPYVVNNLYP